MTETVLINGKNKTNIGGNQYLLINEIKNVFDDQKTMCVIMHFSPPKLNFNTKLKKNNV